MTKGKKEKSGMVPAGAQGQPAETVALQADFGRVFIKQTADGRILAPVKAQMQLSEAKGQLYKIAKKYTISADGYSHLNKVASISIATPPDVSVDGVRQPNPFVERDDRKMILTVNIRKIGVGYSPVGNIVAIDKTLFYNIYTYFIESIQAKMKAEKWETVDGKRRKTSELEYPDCAVIGTFGEDRPKEDFKKGAKWVFLLTQDPLGIWIDYKDPAIQKCLDEHTQRQRFGDRIAATIVERNIYKSHPAIGISQVQPSNLNESGYTPRGVGAVATVTVHGWRGALDSTDITDLTRQAANGSATLDVKAEVVEPDIAEEAAAAEETAVSQDEEITPKPGETEPPDEHYEQQRLKDQAEKEGK